MEFARIANGVVAELVTLPSGFTIGQCYAEAVAAQFTEVPAGVAAAVGWSYASGTFSAPAAPPAPTPAQEAAALLAMGVCVISSAGTAAISGTYGIDPISRATLAEIVAGINAGDGLPGGGASFVYDDIGGAHTFTAGAEVLAVGKGLRDFIYAATQTVQNRTTVVPAQPWPIP